MIRILYITSTLRRTGPTNVMFNLIAKLDRLKYLPTVLTLSEEDKGYPSLMNAFLNIDVQVHSLKLSRIWGFYLGTKRIQDFVNSNGIDVIHNYGFRGDLLMRKTAFPDIPLITTINSNIFEDYTMLYGNLKGAAMARLHIHSLKSKLVVGCSNFVANKLFEKYKCKLKVIYNGIPKEEYKIVSPQEKHIFKEQLGLPLNKTVFIFVGYLIYRKDPLTVIKAFLASKASRESILLIIGDGPIMNLCKSLAGENNNILFLGNQPETLKYLSSSDFYISSAYSEGLPTSVMEAMGCGLPVLLSKIQPHEELVNKIMGWDYLFPLNDSQKLADLMDKIVKENYIKLSKECRWVIDSEINSSVMANEYQKLYNVNK